MVVEYINQLSPNYDNSINDYIKKCGSNDLKCLGYLADRTPEGDVRYCLCQETMSWMYHMRGDYTELTDHFEAEIKVGSTPIFLKLMDLKEQALTKEWTIKYHRAPKGKEV